MERVVCEVWVETWVEDRTREEYMFNSLMKQKKKRRNCDVFCFERKRGVT